MTPWSSCTPTTAGTWASSATGKSTRENPAWASKSNAQPALAARVDHHVSLPGRFVLWELGTRVPLMIKVGTSPRGQGHGRAPAARAPALLLLVCLMC